VTTLSLEDNMPSGIYALYKAVLNLPIKEVAGIPFKAETGQDMADLILCIYLRPAEYPGLDLNEFDKECAQAAESITTSTGVHQEERDAV